MKLGWFLLAFCLLLTRAEARVFNINNERMASYFLVTGGPSAIKQNAFLNESSTTDTYTGEVAINYTGEFGFLYSTPTASLRFGFEVVKPTALMNVPAKNSGGTDIYTLNSDITVYVPKVALELNLQKTNTFRAFLMLAAGTTSASYKNVYTITSYPGVVDHTVEAAGTGTHYSGSLGVESHMTDTTTYIFEFGYRQMKVEDFTYSKAVTTFSGAKAAGDHVLDASGLPRTLDFTGGYVTLGFRFYM